MDEVLIEDRGTIRFGGADVTPANIAVYRIDPPGHRGDPLLPPDLEGASLDRIIAPSPQLLRYALENHRVR